jgi:hypothetical protein
LLLGDFPRLAFWGTAVAWSGSGGEVVNDFESAKVNRAIQRGLVRCRSSAAPIVTLAQLLDDLRSDVSWRESEIRSVETAIRHVLARIVEAPIVALDCRENPTA